MLLLLHHKLGKAPTFKKKKKKKKGTKLPCNIDEGKRNSWKKIFFFASQLEKKSLTSFQQKFLSLSSQKSKTSLFITDFIV